mmetsp:Transcript_21669/g.15931  ORF Transcript_21669/g.15931 Transcript_21669/m.15931 type:complete len:218 (-) Transcript_21669:2886-3539(-)
MFFSSNFSNNWGFYLHIGCLGNSSINNCLLHWNISTHDHFLSVRCGDFSMDVRCSFNSGGTDNFLNSGVLADFSMHFMRFSVGRSRSIGGLRLRVVLIHHFNCLVFHYGDILLDHSVRGGSSMCDFLHHLVWLDVVDGGSFHNSDDLLAIGRHGGLLSHHGGHLHHLSRCVPRLRRSGLHLHIFRQCADRRVLDRRHSLSHELLRVPRLHRSHLINV